MEKERKIFVNVGLPDSFVFQIDKKRGNTPRSEVLRDFILKNMNLNKIKSLG